MRNSYWVLFCLCLPAFTAGAQEFPPKDWPKIAPLKRSYTFVDMGNPAVDLVIPASDGTPLYKLECRSADTYEGKDFDYTGDFECRLNSANGKDAYRTLLTYQPVEPRDSDSRARFQMSDLEGRCGDYPEFGRVRTFRLRGMRVRLSLAAAGHAGMFPSNPGHPYSAAMKFVVEARPDPTALSQIAEDVPYVDPSVVEPAPGTRTCATITPKHVPGADIPGFVQQQRLGPPFESIAPAEASGEIPPAKRIASTKVLRLDNSSSDAPAGELLFHMAIPSKNGATAYDFECDAYGPAIDRRGFRCGLFSRGQTDDLLVDDADPYTRNPRSRFLPAQVGADCAAYPEWGAVRHFSLRGMRLTIELTGVKFSARGKEPDAAGAGIERGQLSVHVEPDSGTRSPVAMAGRILDWESVAGRGTCKQVLVNPGVQK